MSRNRKSRIGIRIIAVAVLIICGVVMYGKSALDREYAALQQRKTQLETQIGEESEREEEIEEYSVYVKTKKFIEDVARRVLGLVDPEDIIIKDKNEE